MPYTNDEIKQFITDKGIGSNPYAQYNYAKQYGVSPGQVDQAMGYASGASDNWIKQSGLQGLAGSAVGGVAPTNNKYDDATVKQFIADKGIGNDPQAMYAYAKQFGVDPSQVDRALGANAGASAGWIQQQGLGALGGGATSLYGSQAPGANTMLQAWQANGSPNVAPSTGVGGVAGTQQQQTGQQMNFGPPPDSSGNWELNPTGWVPKNGGGQQLGQTVTTGPGGVPGGQLGQQNPYLQGMGDNIIRQVTNNLQRNILPGIGRQASAAGGYGGSRQGIAEGLAIGETNNNLAGQLTNLAAGQFNQDRNYGLANDAMDLNVYNANQNWMQQGQQNQINLVDKMLGWNQGGIVNANNAQQQPFNNWNQFVNPAAQIAGQGGSTTQNNQGNPYLGAVGGAQLANSIYTQWNKPGS